MNSLTARIAVMVTALAFSGMLMAPAATYAVAANTAPVQIKVRVSEKGFVDEKGRPYTAGRMLNVPNGTLVTITFVFSEELTSLAVGDTHQIALRAEDGWNQESGKIWVMGRESSITFRAGEKGRTQYRAYCILDCIGMEHLTNLVIRVV